MKRILLALAAVVAFSFVAVAQPRTVGLRAGNYAGEFDFLEFELGLDDAFNTNAFHFDGVYNIMIAQPDWSAYGQWGIYAGPGASVAVWTNEKDENLVYAGLLGNVGLEYIFDFPLQFSLSLRPRLMFGDGKIRKNGLFTLGLGVRYMF